MGEIKEDDDDWRRDLDISGLSLMDEDDSLLFPDPTTSGTTDKEDRGLGLFGDCESSELHKYNLRKSLAWDKAFFTNAGVLEPDELCHMIESNHVGGEKRVLASIQEDVKRSTETISSDCTVEASQGCVLYEEDVRASTSQRSPALSAATPDKTPSTLDDPDSYGKVKPNAIRKRPSIREQRLGKVTNKPVAAAKGHSTSMSRPSTGLSKSVRASVDVNKTKQGEPLTISRRVRSIVSKPALRSSSVASRNELTSSCSSLESCISASSSSASKKSHSLESSVLKQKKASSSLVSASRAAAAASKLIIGQSRVSPLSASSSTSYKPRLPSNASAAFLSASSVDWSFNNSPRAGKGKKKTVSSSPAIDDDPMPDHQQGAKHGTVSSASVVTKPTRIRVPSPKLGYFDGVRCQGRSSVAKTPTGSCTGAGGGSAKRGARSSLNESTTCSRTKSRLIQEESTKGRPVSRLIVSSKLTTSKTYSKVSAEERLDGGR